MFVALVGCSAGYAPAVFADAPVVAVFDIQDRSTKFTPSALDQLTDYLSTKLVEGGVFVVVPRSQIRAALTEQKSASYKQCYDDSCQIEVGRELAAQKSLLTQIVQIGTQCAVTATLFDLRRGASERAANHKTSCDQDALVTALEVVAATLREDGGAPLATLGTPGPQARPEARREAQPAPAGEPAQPAADAEEGGIPTLVWVGIGVALAASILVTAVAIDASSSTDFASGGNALFRF